MKNHTKTTHLITQGGGSCTGCCSSPRGKALAVTFARDAALRFPLAHLCDRTHALHKHRPITLYPTIHLPSFDEIPSDRRVSAGLDLLIGLYKPFDDTFMSLWNKVRTHANPTWIAQLQSQLSEALPAYLECTEIQAVELRITQQWLRTMVWQICVSQGLVSSVATDSAMTFKYPIEISRDLLSMTQQFSQQAMEVHGVGLVSTLGMPRLLSFSQSLRGLFSSPLPTSSVCFPVLPSLASASRLHLHSLVQLPHPATCISLKPRT
jgi:hypothetical protein